MPPPGAVTMIPPAHRPKAGWPGRPEGHSLQVHPWVAPARSQASCLRFPAQHATRPCPVSPVNACVLSWGPTASWASLAPPERLELASQTSQGLLHLLGPGSGPFGWPSQDHCCPFSLPASPSTGIAIVLWVLHLNLSPSSLPFPHSSGGPCLCGWTMRSLPY